MFQIVFKTVHGKFARDLVSRAAHAGSVWAAALDHKAVYHAVKRKSVIVPFFYKRDKVVYGIWCDVGIEFCLDGTASRDFKCYDWIVFIHISMDSFPSLL